MNVRKMQVLRVILMTENELAEINIQKDINKYIDEFKSFRFNSGAGAGKTYALIETLKYVSVNKIASAKISQKVACITYTNVAVNEIKSRLGNSETVHVSTIHERLWEIIKGAQPQLLICHKEKICAVINKIDDDLQRSQKAFFFRELDEVQRQEFICFSQKTRDFFYKNKKLNSKDFVNSYKNNTNINLPVFWGDCVRNVTNFKYVVGLLYNKENLNECLERISAGKEHRVDYDQKANTDRLHYMKFSHGTLLEYSLKLVEDYPILCRIIIDTYQYFFIDEYQDTHSSVIKFLKNLHDYAIKNKKEWMVGYFGDTAQNIYEDGVGRGIVDIHNGLVDVDKIFNRRSHQQVIDVANNIRADDIIQRPIYEESNTGSVLFFHNKSEDKIRIAKDFLSEYKKDITKYYEALGCTDIKIKRIHCLVLTNKLMAEFNGFDDVYQVYSDSKIYHENLNTQVLSQQLEKLHPTVLSIYQFVKLYQDIQISEVSYHSIFGSSSKNITFSKASSVIRELNSKKVEKFVEWIYLIRDGLGSSDARKELAQALVNRIGYEKDKFLSSDIFELTVLDSINNLMNDGSENEDDAQENVGRILSLPMSSLIKWVNFIDGMETEDFMYHTYHGSKGEEYNNVAIILEHNFGARNKDKFKNYFKFVQENIEGNSQFISGSDEEKNHINTKNLLYVACSRAIKNLRVLYLDDISEIVSGINAIFGECKPWPKNGI